MLKIFALLSILAITVFAAGDSLGDMGKSDLNIPAIIMFFIFIAGTLGIKISDELSKRAKFVK